MVQLNRIEIAGEVRAAHAPTRASEGVTGVVPSSYWLLNVGSNKLLLKLHNQQW